MEIEVYVQGREGFDSATERGACGGVVFGQSYLALVPILEISDDLFWRAGLDASGLEPLHDAIVPFPADVSFAHWLGGGVAEDFPRISPSALLSPRGSLQLIRERTIHRPIIYIDDSIFWSVR